MKGPPSRKGELERLKKEGRDSDQPTRLIRLAARHRSSGIQRLQYLVGDVEINTVRHLLSSLVGQSVSNHQG